MRTHSKFPRYLQHGMGRISTLYKGGDIIHIPKRQSSKSERAAVRMGLNDNHLQILNDLIPLVDRIIYRPVLDIQEIYNRTNIRLIEECPLGSNKMSGCNYLTEGTVAAAILLAAKHESKVPVDKMRDAFLFIHDIENFTNFMVNELKTEVLKLASQPGDKSLSTQMVVTVKLTKLLCAASHEDGDDDITLISSL